MKDPLSNCAYRKLPEEAIALLRRVSAPPRLIAHLILVHDVAAALIEQIDQAFPGLTFDRDAVLFGAAVHDIGKAIHGNESDEAGNRHDKRGLELLRAMGIPEHRARFAYTHRNWSGGNVAFEDLLVAMADKWWKGKRIEQLESIAADYLARVSQKPRWTCYSMLDEILESVAKDAQARLSWQATFSLFSSRAT